MTRQLERQRQQALAQHLLAPGGLPPAGLRPLRVARGLAAYETNAAGQAERALAGTSPTVLAMLGAEPFERLARALWLQDPPTRGDLAAWGDGLPAFLAAEPSLADWPYLADCARLDLAVSRCAQAADVQPATDTLVRLGDTDAARVAIDLAPGVALVESRFPVVTLWSAHRDEAGPERLAAARETLARGRGEQALVWRAGWRPEVSAVDPSFATFTGAVLQGLSLGDALERAGDGFAFDAWLVSAVRDGWWWRVRTLP